MKKRVKASLTVEAAIAMFLVSMFLACFLLLFPTMKKEMVHEKALISTCQEGACVSVYKPKATTAFLIAEGMRRVRAADRGKWSLIFGKNTEEGSLLTISMKTNLPFGYVSRMLKMKDIYYVRHWQGFHRNREQDLFVYITKTGSVYHRLRSCYHLLVSIKSVQKAQVGACRNNGGAKYYPCENCGRYAGAIVYITPEGNRYHSRKTCKNLLRFIKRVPLSEVVNTHRPCKHCAEGEGEKHEE